MALKRAVATDTFVVLGLTDPYAYDAGEYEGRAYPAGMTQKLCVAPADPNSRDFFVMKLKTDTVQRLRDLLAGLKRGTVVEVDYDQARGNVTCVDVRVLQPAKA